MSKEGFTIAEAASHLGVSGRTIRRFIKSGKIHAELIPGQFGAEYRILELPPDLIGKKRVDNPTVESSGITDVQPSVQAPANFMEVIRELQDKNLSLAAQLGAATERIRNLESQVRLLTTARRPWWSRLFRRKS